ncbi:MAG: HU family DNA-binding protein [Muribaculaceae bacterium]|nr:HU family DNA-binding protein [Muribaculaceae bacterium]
MNNKITFPELVDLVAQKANTSKRMSEVFLKEFFATISSAMIEGDSVKVKGLGTFKVTAVKERSTRSVNDGGIITIPDHKKITFVPDPAMARTINTPFEHFEVVTLDDEVTDEKLDEIDKSIDAPAPETLDNEDETQAENVEELVEEPKQEQVPLVQQEEPQEEPVEEPAPQVMPPVFVATPPLLEEQRETSPEPAKPIEPPTIPAATPPAPVPPVAPVPAPEELPTIPVAPPTSAPKVPEAPVAVAAPVSEVPEAPITPVTDAAALRRSWWRGFAVGALAMLLVALLVGMLSHCGKTSGENDEPAIVVSDTTANDSAAVQPATTAAPVMTDTVTDKKEDWPVNIAKRHYGHEVFWVYIYLENKDKLNDYMKVPTGTVLVIPPAEKYGIDASDPASIKKAQDEANRAYIESMK